MEDIKRKYKEHEKWFKACCVGLGVAGLVYWGYKCYTYDSVKYLESPAQLRSHYDFIVIGAGTSGCVVARRLCEDASHPSVLLIEAGPPDDATLFSQQSIPAAAQLNQKTEIDFQFETICQNKSCFNMVNNKSCWPRGKVMGGSSILNYCVYVRGSKHDFDSWSNKDTYDCQGWSYNDILPFYMKAENINLNDSIFSKISKMVLKEYRGLNGPLCISHRQPISEASKLFMQAAMSVGYKKTQDYNGINDGLNDGVSHTQYTIKNGKRHSSFRAYIEPLFNEMTKSNENKYDISILPYSFVTKILTSNKNNTNKNNNNRNTRDSERKSNNDNDDNDNKNNENEDSLIATGIEFCFKDNRNKTYRVDCNYSNGGEIILCGGAVSSPQLLLLSGIGPRNDLETLNINCVVDIPGVGNNLQDHFMGGIRMTVPKSIPLLNDKVGSSLSSLYDYAIKGEGWLTTGLLDCHVFTHSTAKEKHGILTKFPDLQLVCMNVEDNPDKSKMGLYFNYKENTIVTKSVKNENEANHSICGLIMVMHPTSKGYIKLNTNNAFDKPIINPNYLNTQYDIDCAIDGAFKVVEIFQSNVYKNLGCQIVYVNDVDKRIEKCKELDKDGRNIEQKLVFKEAFENWTHTIYHPVGTCKMGNIKKDEMAVVNCQNLKVKKFNNLRVIDASIMPHLITGNTQAPCYMIGEKGAWHVLNDWKNTLRNKKHGYQP